MDRQKKIDEAIKRMKTLGIYSDTVESFKKGKKRLSGGFG